MEEEGRRAGLGGCRERGGVPQRRQHWAHIGGIKEGTLAFALAIPALGRLGVPKGTTEGAVSQSPSLHEGNAGFFLASLSLLRRGEQFPLLGR